MRPKFLVGALALCVLSACENAPPEAPVEYVEKRHKPKPLSQVDPEAYKMNVESAVGEIPPALRADFQKLLVCTVRNERAQGVSRPLNAERIRELVAQLKANPAAAASC